MSYRLGAVIYFIGLIFLQLESNSRLWKWIPQIWIDEISMQISYLNKVENRLHLNLTITL